MDLGVAIFSETSIWEILRIEIHQNPSIRHGFFMIFPFEYWKLLKSMVIWNGGILKMIWMVYDVESIHKWDDDWGYPDDFGTPHMAVSGEFPSGWFYGKFWWKWCGIPNRWMVSGKNPCSNWWKLVIFWGYPHFRKPPHDTKKSAKVQKPCRVMQSLRISVDLRMKKFWRSDEDQTPYSYAVTLA